MDSAQVVTMLPYAIYSLMFLTVFWVLIKLSTHRIMVEKLQIVKDGYVSSFGRYALAKDKKTSLVYLKPMFGPEKLPPFSSDCFQKVRGAPIFGTRRAITLIFKNKHSPVVCLPVDDKTLLGTIKPHEVKRWYYTDQRETFLKAFNKGDFAYFLTIYAPILVILGAVIFWALMIYFQTGITKNLGAELSELVKRLEAVLT